MTPPKALCLAAFTAALTAGCGSPSTQPTPVSVSPTVGTTAPSTPRRVTTPSETDPRATCTALATSDVLTAAEGFALVSSVVEPGDVNDTVTELRRVADTAPGAYQDALNRIASTLQQLDAVISGDLDVQAPDLSTIQTGARLLASMCHRVGVPLPDVV